MGWPLLIIGALAAAAGTGAQMAASGDERDAMNKATEAELKRQQGFRQKSQEAVNTNIGQNTPSATKESIDSGVKQALDNYSKFMTVNTASAPTASPSDSSYLVPSEGQTKANEEQLRSAAQLQGWENLGLQQGLNNAKANSLLGEYANFARGSQNVLPIELNAASQSAEGLRGIGQLSSLLGSIGMMGGGAMLAAPTAATTGAGSSASISSANPIEAAAAGAAAGAPKMATLWPSLFSGAANSLSGVFSRRPRAVSSY